MLSGHRPPPRRRGVKGRAKRIAVPFAIPMALGLTLGIMLAVSDGNTTHIDQSPPLGTSARPSASASAPATVPAASPGQPKRGGQPQRSGRAHHLPTASPMG